MTRFTEIVAVGLTDGQTGRCTEVDVSNCLRPMFDNRRSQYLLGYASLETIYFVMATDAVTFKDWCRYWLSIYLCHAINSAILYLINLPWLCLHPITPRPQRRNSNVTKTHLHSSNSDTVQQHEQCIKAVQPDCLDTVQHRLEGLRRVVQFTCGEPDKFKR